MVYKSINSYIDEIRERIIEIHGICNDYGKRQIKHISYNSRDVREGTLFICKGASFRKDYLKSAIKKGAICYVADKRWTEDIPGIIVDDVRESISLVSGHFYNNIWNKKLDIVGITGTKGKSTTAFLIKAVLDSYHQRIGDGNTALISGIYNYDGRAKQKATLTTPETLELHKLLAESVDNCCDTLVMEVSSQGLKYKRVHGIKYKIGVFLNIGIDHISEGEHLSFEDYFQSKMEIFKQCDIACINIDMEDEYLFPILDNAIINNCRIVTFGTKKGAKYRGKLVKESLTSLKFELSNNGIDYLIDACLGGGYNLSNILAAIAVCKELGVSVIDIKNGLSNVEIPGRMEVFDMPNKDSKIIVDYAHNEMSYNSLFESINRNYPNYKRIFMFGCAADRALNRRREVAKIAIKEADRVVITKYDNGKETFEEISKEILRNIRAECGLENALMEEVDIIEDRTSAIEYCINNIEDGWILIMTGCESDSKTVKEYLKRCYKS